MAWGRRVKTQTQGSRTTNPDENIPEIELPKGTSLREFFEYLKNQPGKVESITFEGKTYPVDENAPINRGR